MASSASISEVRPAALSQVEQTEAAAFDRIADRLDRAYLRTSDWTFGRYRAAVLGRPLLYSYPDLVFVHLGKCFPGPKDPRRPLAGVRVLDLGAGDGVWSVILAEQGAEVTSIEISPKQVSLAHERMRIHGLSWEARIGSAFRLEEELPGRSFDLVFSQAILHHLTQDLPRVYQGMHALLRPGGHATMTEPYCGSARMRRIREKLAWLLPVDCESPDERPLQDEDLAPLPRLFARVEMDRFELLSRVARRLWRRGGLESALYRLDRAILARPACRHLAGGIFIAATK